METQYIQYDSLHQAFQAHFRRQQLDTKCRMRCQESDEVTTSQLECEDQKKNGTL